MANTAAKKITYDGKPVQVESAIRDGSGKVISSTYAPKFTVTDSNPALAWGTKSKVATVAGTDIHVTMPANPDTHNNKVTQKSWASDDEGRLAVKAGINDNDATDYMYFTPGVTVNGSTKVITAGGFNGPQVGGKSQTYELKATGYKVVATLDKDIYWTTNSGQARIKLLVEYSQVPFGTTATLDVRKGIWLVRINYSGNDQGLVIESLGDSVGTGNGTLRYFRSYVPKNTSYGPQIAVAQENANVKVYIRVTMLAGTPGWNILSTFGADPGTGNHNQWTSELGRYNYLWSSYKISASITGSCDGTSGSTWDALRNDRYIFGETAVSGSLMAKASDGRMYHLRNGANKEFTLPLHLGRCTGTFTYNGSANPPTLSNYAQVMWNMRGMAYGELINTSMQGSAFTVPTLTSADFGKTLYVTGSLSNGNFKPDGNITLAMVKSKTNIPIGRIDRANNALNTVPNQFTVTGYSQTAYTLDANGRLTHIDGKVIHAGRADYAAEAESTIMMQYRASISNNRSFTRVSTSTSLSTDVSGYPWEYRMSLPDASTDHVPLVTFGIPDLNKGVWSPICNVKTNGYLTIYSKTDLGPSVTVSCGYVLN